MQIIAAGLLGGFVFCSTAVLAQDQITAPEPDDFAYGMDVQEGDSHAFQAFYLPDHYYKTTTRKDGLDLRVFNVEGESLPFSISTDNVESRQTFSHALPLFPVFGKSADQLKGLALRIDRNTGGTVIDINESAKEIPGEKVIAYVIDNSYSLDDETKGRLAELAFDWEQPEYGFVSDITLESSDDLKNWRHLSGGESLSRLAYEGEVIGRQAIAFAGKAGRFIRMTWKEGEDFKLTGVTAHYQWSQTERELHWQEYHGLIKVEDAEQDKLEYGAYRFSVTGRAPVQRFTFRFDDDNAFYRGQLYSRMDNDSKWVSRGHFLQYRLKLKGGVVESDALILPSARDGEWLIKFDTPSTFKEGRLPVIRLGWYPERLIFLAQGKPPYTLAYGNPRVEPAHTELASLLKSLDDDEREEVTESLATLGEVRELGGVSRLQPEPEKFPWRKVVLWLVLIIGVLVMAKMAVSLFRQMDSKKN